MPKLGRIALRSLILLGAVLLMLHRMRASDNLMTTLIAVQSIVVTPSVGDEVIVVLPPLPPLQSMPQSVVVALDSIMNQRIAADQRATFVQIGANDGITFDPLYAAFTQRQRKGDLRKHWVGLQVEPQKNLFDMLSNISSPLDWSYYNGVVIEEDGLSEEAGNIAHCVNGTVLFCETKTPGVGDWKTQGQINTVDKARCGRNKNMHLVSHPCVSSYTALLQAARPAFHSTTTGGTLDFLQIDVEGQDFAVMKLLLQDTRPLCIHYEHFHLQPSEIEAAVNLLENAGYTLLREHPMDTLACLVG